MCWFINLFVDITIIRYTLQMVLDFVWNDSGPLSNNSHVPPTSSVISSQPPGTNTTSTRPTSEPGTRHCNITLTSKLWSSQLWTQFKQLRVEAWKSQDFNWVWTRDHAIPLQRSKQLSYEATDVGSWSFVSSNEPVTNECEVIYEMLHILNWGCEIK